jgi:hypothetical protein
MQSEVTQLLRQIEQEYQAAQQGLTGLASGTARHDFITSKAENMSKCHEKLIEIIGPEQAIALIANTIWMPTEQGTIS